MADFNFEKVDKLIASRATSPHLIRITRGTAFVGNDVLAKINVPIDGVVTVDYDRQNHAIRIQASTNGAGWKLSPVNGATSGSYMSKQGLARAGALDGEYAPVEGVDNVYKLVN